MDSGIENELITFVIVFPYFRLMLEIACGTL